MDLESISKLSLEDEGTVIRVVSRLRDFSKVPEGEKPYFFSGDKELHSPYDRLKLHNNFRKPDYEKFESELNNLKSELRQQEIKRLEEQARVADLKDRFDALKDMRAAFHNTITDEPNPLAWFNKMSKMEDKEEAERLMKKVESKDHQIQLERKSSEWKKSRKEEYQKIDDMFLEALAEKEEGRPQKMEEYLLLRENIKSKHPKS